MKFLLDENISRRIIPLLGDSLGEVTYLISPKTDLVPPVSDHLVWKYAKENGYNIITRDDDFIKLSLLLGAPPKVVYLNTGNLNNSNLAEILKNNADQIKDFILSESFGFLVIKG
jgi:predicted nuclease of predicted toxin-antitoxin system